MPRNNGTSHQKLTAYESAQINSDAINAIAKKT
jgi:hypothetical protein